MEEYNSPDCKTQNQPTRRSISVFFPCHNEQDTIEPLVRKTMDTLRKLTDDFEIIIVNDGSTDQTGVISDQLAEEISQVRAIHHEVNGGYGAALQSGFRGAIKDLVFYTDGDGQFDIAELENILPLINDFDIVSCYRINRQEGLIRKFNAGAWTKLVCFLFDMKLKDIDCAFKLFKRKIFNDIEMHSTGALIDTEVLARALRKGYTVTQAPVKHYPRTAGSSSGSNPAVIFRAFKELIKLRKQILAK